MSAKTINRREFIKLLGAASLAASGVSSWKPFSKIDLQKTSQNPNILILVFDALTRHDMSLYGFSRHTTPHLEKFADQAAVYHRHYSGGSFTTPGTASLLTGVHPWVHRGIHLQGQTSSEFESKSIFHYLPNSYHRFAYTHNTFVQTLLDQVSGDIDDLLAISDLAEFSALISDHLPSEEYSVLLASELLTLKNFYTDESSFFLSYLDAQARRLGSQKVNQRNPALFPRGVTSCRQNDPTNTSCFSLEEAVDWLIAQVQQRPQPFFGYIHLFPPHAPYNSRQEFIGQFSSKPVSPKKLNHHFSEDQSLKNMERQRVNYDEAIAYVDSEFGRLIDALKTSRALENTCLILTSDHGEIFERGIIGHNTPVLYEPLLNIPLVISYPGQNHHIDVHTPTHAVDVLPTVLQLSGGSLPNHLQGSLLPIENQDFILNRDLLFCDAKSNPKNGSLQKATFALLRYPYKLIYYRGYREFDQVYELYDLSNDPEEMNNLYTSEKTIASELEQALQIQIRDL